MGTSSSYGGPGGTNALLPPWADESGSDSGGPPTGPDQGLPPQPLPVQPPDEPEPVPEVPWRIPKSRVTRAAHAAEGRRVTLLRSSFKGYVRASGGGGAAAQRARAGRRAFARSASFLSLASQVGFGGAARQIFGLQQLVGRDVHTVLVDIAGRVAPPGAMNEEAAARAATISAFSEFAEDLISQDRGLDALDHLDSPMIADVLRRVISNYVTERFLQELVIQVERSRISTADAEQMLSSVRDLIQETVRIDFRDIDVATFDWRGAAGRERVERIFREAYSLLEEP